MYKDAALKDNLKTLWGNLSGSRVKSLENEPWTRKGLKLFRDATEGGAPLSGPGGVYSDFGLRNYMPHIEQYGDALLSRDSSRMAVGGLLAAGLGTAGAMYAHKRQQRKEAEKTASDNAYIEMPIIIKQAMLEKIAIPWGAIAKGVGTFATKAWSNPMARRAITGAAIGGTGNALLGSPNQGGIAKRFLAGAAIGGAGGATYHGAVKMGLPSVTAMGKKVAPTISKSFNKMMNSKPMMAANNFLNRKVTPYTSE